MWPSGPRRCVKAAVRKGAGSNPAIVIDLFTSEPIHAEAFEYLDHLGGNPR